MATLAEALSAALAHHQRGALAQAETIYRQILAIEPEQADAWHYLGVAAYQQGRHGEAIEVISRAITINPNQPAFHNHLGAAQAALGDLVTAEACFRRALQLAPGDHQTHYNLANLLKLQGNDAAALPHYRSAVELAPHMAEAHFNLGNLLQEQGDWSGAETSYQAALAAQPRYLKALVNLATLYTKRSRDHEARELWKVVLDMRRAALARNPQDVETLVGLGAAQHGLGDFAAARHCYSQALALKPGDRNAEYNLGSALLTEGNYPEAERCFRSVVTAEPGFADGRFRLGQCLQFEGHFSAALEQYDEALAGKPNDAEFHYYRATNWLASGDFERGWPEYEWRLQTHYAGPPFPQRRWQGEKLHGARIVVYAEWGLGDTLQFVRYLPRIQERGGEVILAVQPGLIPLLNESGFEQVHDWRSARLPDCQWQCPIMSLPGIFRTTPDTIPAPIPYLQARPSLIETWGQRLRQIAGRKIGIHWHGSKSWSTDLRSIPLAAFAPLAAIPDVTLVSLQRNADAEEHPDFAGSLVDFGPELDAAGAFLDTAAIMQHLDLVITCDTSIAHLAGALGVHVWVALPRASEWRWQWNRDDSPWYPTMRLFRQPKFNDWATVFEQIAASLAG